VIDSRPEAFLYFVRLARLEAWLDECYPDDASLSVAARVVGLSEKYFSRFFREKTGLRYSEWVNGVRVEKAMQRMRQSNYSITTVAYDVGFQDLRTFERVFKKLTGLTPRDFRSRVRPGAHRMARTAHLVPFRLKETS